MPEPLPDGVEAIRESPAGRAWVASLPTLLAEVAEAAVPHREAEHEAAALALWDGAGAVRLLADDPDRHALLLELCEPGTPLSELHQDDARGATTFM